MRTQLTTRQILDRTITSDDVDISTPGKSMLTRIVPGANITLTHNTPGATNGAGEVKVSVQMFGEWATGVVYGAESIIRYQGILLRVLRDHDTTGLTFQECLEYYSPLSSSIRIINSDNHGIPAFKPVFMYNQTTVQAARSNSTDTCSTHITLVVNNNWLLIADMGEYTFASHGIGGAAPAPGTVKFMYLSASTAGSLVEGKAGLTNVCPVVTVLDANRFVVTTYRGIVNLGSSGLTIVTRDDLDTTTANKAVVAKIKAGPGISITQTGVDSGTGDVTIHRNDITAQDVSIIEGTKNLLGAHTVKDAMAIFDDFKSSIDNWTATYPYRLGDTAIWNGLLFTCTTAHTSSTSFKVDLSKWHCNSPNAVIRSDGNMFSPLHLIYINDSGVATKAIANSDTSCAEYVVITTSSGGYYLAANAGRFNSVDILPAIIDGTPFGPFPTGRFYCSSAVAGDYTQTVPAYNNPVFTVSTDRTIVDIESHMDVVCNIPSQYDNIALIASVDFAGEPLDFTVNVPAGINTMRVVWALEANNASATIQGRFDSVTATANYYVLRSYYAHSTNSFVTDDFANSGVYMGNITYYSHGEMLVTMPASSSSNIMYAHATSSSYASGILYKFDTHTRHTRPSTTSPVQTFQITGSSVVNVTGYIRVYASR